MTKCHLREAHFSRFLVCKSIPHEFTTLWGGYISRIYPESTQELNQILGPFWSVYKAESPQDLKKSVNKPELTQKVPRKSFKFWALSGLFALF